MGDISAAHSVEQMSLDRRNATPQYNYYLRPQLPFKDE